jgi:hypothetical protein
LRLVSIIGGRVIVDIIFISLGTYIGESLMNKRLQRSLIRNNHKNN